MSYARLSVDSDVYVYRSEQGYVCAMCYVFDDIPDLLAHLRDHLRSGDKVPEYAFVRLEDEWAAQLLGPETAGAILEAAEDWAKESGKPIEEARREMRDAATKQ